ncbi:hypothetical protein CRUP_003234 [Coryphaenoides rupestris]|nr:hypothetical protein CRUP_003234 [Coryphaenoides rupestris]
MPTTTAESQVTPSATCPLSSPASTQQSPSTLSDPPRKNGIAGVASTMTPKLARAAPKIFDKVLAFEVRHSSLCAPGPRLTRAASCGGDSDSVTAAQRRSAFKQRASSLEDACAGYAQRVQSFQNKFTEELQRIKRLASKPGLKKSYSTEQLAQRDAPQGPRGGGGEGGGGGGGRGGGGGGGGGGGSVAGKLEPIPPQVVKKLEARERALEEQRGSGGGGRGKSPPRKLPDEASGGRRAEAAPGGAASMSQGAQHPTPCGAGKISSVAMETEPVHQLPAGPVPAVRTRSAASESLVAETQSVKQPRLSASTTAPSRQLQPPPESAAVRREPAGSLSRPAKSPPMPVPSVSPLLKRRKGPSPVPKILVEEVVEVEEVEAEVDVEVEGGNARSVAQRRGGERGHRGQPEPPMDGPAHKRCGRSTVARNASSPSQSDEGSLTLREEAMELEVRPTRGKHVHFNEPPSFQVAPYDQAVGEGQEVVLSVRARGNPSIYWLKERLTLKSAGRLAVRQTGEGTSELRISSAQRSDAGLYACKIVNEFGTKQCDFKLEVKEELTSSAKLNVTPTRDPLFTRKLDILEVIEGRTARFDCKEGGRHSLVIGRISTDTEGFYTAVATNCHGTAETTAELYMQEPRAAAASHMARLEKMPSIPEEPEVLESEVERRTMPDFAKPLADVEVIEGKEALLKCRVAGLPYPSIAWYHNGKRIDGSEERKMTQHRDVHSLVIRSACHAHGGVYKSVISNRVGKAACYAHLYVTDIVPDPPDGPPVVESITGKTITLSWKKPKRMEQSSEAVSLLYAVQQQALGSIQWSIVASNLKETGYTVSSLCKGVRYAFRVLSSTGKAFSKPSAATDLVQPAWTEAPIIMDKPDVVHVVENQSVSITITLNHVHAVVTWKRRGAMVVHRPGTYEISMPDDDQHTLKFLRVRRADVGALVVMANNQFGSDLCTLELALAVSPKFESIMEDQDLDTAETTRLAVVVEGKPDPDILWYKVRGLLVGALDELDDDKKKCFWGENVHPDNF